MISIDGFSFTALLVQLRTFLSLTILSVWLEIFLDFSPTSLSPVYLKFSGDISGDNAILHHHISILILHLQF